MKEVLLQFANLFKILAYFLRKEIFEMSNLSKCMGFERYLMEKHEGDRENMKAALDIARKEGKSSFYSEVYKTEITIITNT